MNPKLSFGVVLTSVMLSSCSLPFGSGAGQKRAYSMELGATRCVRERPPSSGTLLVREILGENLTNSQRILYRETVRRLASYQLSQWVQPATEILTNEFLKRLQQVAPFSSVSRSSGSVVGDYQLNIQLHDFSLHRDRNPRVVEVSFTAELVRLMNREIISQKQFVLNAESAGDDPESAVLALEQGAAQGLSSVCGWLEQVRP